MKKILSQGYHETKNHSQFLFDYNVYPCTIPLDFPYVFPHWHKSMEFIYVKKGTGCVIINTEKYIAKAGDIFIIPPAFLHEIKPVSSKRFEYENIIFSLEFLGLSNHDICSQNYLIPLSHNKIELPVLLNQDSLYYQEIKSKLDDSDSLCDKKPLGYELAVKGNMLCIFSVLFKLSKNLDSYSKQQNKHLSANTEKLKSVLNLIETSYSHNISIHDAASVCGFSESHFMRWFKNLTGYSFTSYLNSIRLTKAYYALIETNLTILDISEQCGFHNLSNFNRQFKNCFHVTPVNIRQSIPETVHR